MLLNLSLTMDLFSFHCGWFPDSMLTQASKSRILMLKRNNLTFSRRQTFMAMIRENLGHNLVGWDPSVLQVQPVTCSHPPVFPLLNWGIILEIPPEWSVILLQSWTSTGYVWNSTGSSVTNCLFSPITDSWCISEKHDSEFVDCHHRHHIF